MAKTIWLRHETKQFEERSALTPEAAGTLKMLGHDVIVESSPTRCFSDEEFARVGCKIVPTNSWIKDAPTGAIILGLKELEDKDFPLTHRHIHFAHVYKGQDGAEKTLSRFIQGDGKLYDLEYLTNENGRRVAAFGVWAGFVGAGLGVRLWANQQLGINLNEKAPLSSAKNKEDFIMRVLKELDKVEKKPRVLVIGASGRCGKGAVKLLREVGIEPVCWTSKDTKNRGPISEILGFDLLINAAFIANKTLPFLNKDILKNERNLTAISDVGCDPTGPCNPLPIYSQSTTMDEPVLTLDKNNLLEITAIDHLPSLLPRESSEDFCDQLLPHLIDFLDNKIENSPWERALELFYETTMKLGLKQDVLEKNKEETKLM
jgi:saccharopine dehydrogenase (NAD+, L-lysine-forming)